MDSHAQQPLMSLQPLMVQLSKEQYNIWEEALQNWEDVQDPRWSSCGSSKAQRYIMYLIDQSKPYQRRDEQDKCSDVGNNQLMTESNGIATDVKEGVMEDYHSKDLKAKISDLHEQSATSRLSNPPCLTTMESGQAKICAGDYYSGFDELCSASPLAKEALISAALQYICKASFKISEATITYAWVFIIDAMIQQLGEPISKYLPTCFSSLDTSITLPSRMTALLAKTRKLAEACQNDEEVLSKLHVPVRQLYSSPSIFIGDECQTVGIDANSLQTEFSQSPKLTVMMVYELEIFRTKKVMPQTAIIKWLSNIIGVQHLSSLSEQSILDAIASIKNRKQKADHHRNAQILMEMRQQEFSLPGKNIIAETVIAASSSNKKTKLLTTKLTKANINLKDTTTQLKRTRKEDERKGQLLEEQRHSFAECKKWKKTLEKKEEKLQKRAEDLDELESYCKPHNVKRRDKTCHTNMRKLEETVVEQKKTIIALEDQLEIKAIQTKQSSAELRKRRESRNYFQQTNEELRRKEQLIEVQKSMKLQDEVWKLKAENRELKKQLNIVTMELEEVREKNKPHLRKENGEISNEVWECYMRLMSLGVSAKNMSQVAEAVLTIICKHDIGLNDLPKETSCKKVPLLANSIATHHVVSELKETKYATQHSDGTSRDGAKVVDFEVTVDGGKTLTTGILPVASGDSQTQLETFKFLMAKLACTLDAEDSSKVAKELVSKIKSTMGDQAATQKSFNEKLEAYRSTIVPDVVENWNSLESSEQESLLSMNHFFCNLHALIGFATYSDKGLQTLEAKWREEHRQLGTENLKEFQNKSGEYAWKHVDSATQRLIRTACRAFPPGGDQKSGAIGAFQSYRKLKEIKHMEIKPFRANRFNILFANAAGVFYHRKHIVDLFDGDYIKASNKLLRAVLADVKSEQLMAGVRALGIMHKQFTEPYWRLVERKDVTVLDMTSHVQKSFAKLQQLATDPSLLLKDDHPPVFVLPNGEELLPVKDHVFAELYSAVELDNDTTEALRTVCSSLITVYERRFVDQLDGGKYSGETSAQLQEETKDTLKSNKRGENDFGYWAWITSNKPTMTDVNTEGQCLYRLNRSDKYLNNMRAANPAEYRRIMKAALRGRKQLHRLYSQLSSKIAEEKIQRLKEHQKEQHLKKAKQKTKLAARKKLLRDHGGECCTKEEVEAFVNSTTLKTKQISLLRQHIMHIKETYDLTDLEDKKKLTVISNKSIECLKADLITLVKYVHSNSTPLVNEDSGEDGDEDADGFESDSTTSSEESDIETESSEDEASDSDSTHSMVGGMDTEVNKAEDGAAAEDVPSHGSLKDMVKLLKCTKLLRGIECAEDLQRFSWQEVLHEANDLCPDLVTLIDTLLQQCRHIDSILPPPKVKRPNVAVGMILAQLLHYQDPINYRATQQITSLLLHLSGCKDQRMYLSLSHLGVCLGPSSTLDIVKRLKTKPDVCETFKTTDLGSLGSDSRPLKLGSIALKRRETKEQEEVLKQLKEEEMEVDDQWKDQLKQAAAEMGLDEEDLNNSDSEDSSWSSINVFSSGDDIDEDRLEEIQFDKRTSDLNPAAEEIGVVTDDSVKSNSSYSTDDICGDDDDSSKGANQDMIEHSNCTDLGNVNNKFVYTERQPSENVKSCGAQISHLILRKEREKLDILLSGEVSVLQQYGEDSVTDDTIGTTESAQLEQTHNHTSAGNKRSSKQPQSPPNAKRSKRHEDSKQQHRER